MKKFEKDLYFVAVKVFMRDKNGKLFIFKDRFGDWDLPGGRIKQNEFNKPLEKIIARKMREELGGKVVYKLGQPVVFMRHERDEVSGRGKDKKVRIFAIGYEAKYQKGEINLGKNHLEYKLVGLKNFKPEKYFKGGWLKGVRDYKKLCM